MTVLMFIFSKYSPFNFSDTFGLKILLQLSQKTATIAACHIFCFPELSKFVSETRVLE